MNDIVCLSDWIGSSLVTSVTEIFCLCGDNVTKSHWDLYKEPYPQEVTGSKGGIINETIFTNQK